MRLSKYTTGLLSPIVESSTSVAEVLRKLGLKRTGGNFRYITGRLKYLNISISHFKGHRWHKGKVLGKNFFGTLTPLEKILVKCSTYSCSTLRKRLIDEGLKLKQCELCSLSVWRGVELKLELHHKNKDHTDHRFANLQILCPNCHSIQQ